LGVDFGMLYKRDALAQNRIEAGLDWLIKLGKSKMKYFNETRVDISLFNPAVMCFSVSLPFHEILDHTSSITAFAQVFDGVLVVIIQGGRTAVD
jgi:hypothetical protein